MPRKPLPVFLERSSYRKRRVMDALKLIAVFGFILWMIPTLWPDGSDPDTAPVSMSDALFYVFGVWLVLIVLSAAFVSRQSEPKDTGQQRDTGS